MSGLPIDQEKSEIKVDLPFFENEKSYQTQHDLLSSNHLQTYSQEQKDTLLVPLSVFSKGGSTLRLLVSYLKDVQKLSFHEIARQINRSYIAVYTTYHAAHHADSTSVLSPEPSAIMIPLYAFASRSFSPLESLVAYLSRLHLRQNQIAVLLKKDARTIWTIQSRIAKKENSRQEEAS
jgi:hypothetical protein